MVGFIFLALKSKFVLDLISGYLSKHYCILNINRLRVYKFRYQQKLLET